MKLTPEELVIPEYRPYTAVNITSFRISGGYNIPALKRIGEVTEILYKSEFETETDFNEFYTAHYDKYGRDGLFKYEYLKHMCACLRDYTKGGFGNEGIWLRPEDLPSPDYSDIKESYYPLPIPLELLDKFGYTYLIGSSENTNHEISKRCRCRDVPLITGELMYQIKVFAGSSKQNTITLRKYCWEREFKEKIIDKARAVRWDKSREVKGMGRPRNPDGIELTDSKRKVRKTTLIKIYQAHNRYKAADQGGLTYRKQLALVKMKELVDELDSFDMGGIPETWHWVRDERIS